MSSPVPRLAESEVYDILRNDRRRAVIQHLQSIDGAMTVGDLADVIAESEAGESPPPRNVRQSVYVSLHQTHLPRLDDAAIVAFDSVQNEVELLDGVSAVSGYLETKPTTASCGQWSKLGQLGPRVVFGLTLLGVSLVVVSLLGVSPISVVAPAYWALLVFAAIASTTVPEVVRAVQTQTRR